MTVRPWRRALLLIGLCLAASAAFVTPLFFESEVVRAEVRSTEPEPARNGTSYRYRWRVTELRTRRAYVFWYKNVATYVLTVLLPACALIFWNANTVRLMRRRRAGVNAAAGNANAAAAAAAAAAGPAAAVPAAEAQHRGQHNSNNSNSSARLTSSESGAVKSEETTARILFALTVLFFVCNSFRVVVMTEEVLANRDHLLALKHGCSFMPFWVVILNRVSLFLLTVNASLAPAVYCAMSRDFRLALTFRARRAGRRLCARLKGRGGDAEAPVTSGAGASVGDNSRRPSSNNNSPIANQVCTGLATVRPTGVSVLHVHCTYVRTYLK